MLAFNGWIVLKFGTNFHNVKSINLNDRRQPTGHNFHESPLSPQPHAVLSDESQHNMLTCSILHAIMLNIMLACDIK